jgi:hypothetical protein
MDRSFSSSVSTEVVVKPKQSSVWKTLPSKVAPTLLGTLLCLANNLDVIHAYFSHPPGYLPLGVQRTNDIAMYLTWMKAMTTEWLLPNFHAAWSTPHNFLVLPLVPAAILERQFAFSPLFVYQLYSFVAYVFAVNAVAFAYRTFCENRRQAVLALLLALACVPLGSLPFASHFSGHYAAPGDVPGRHAFFLVSDGFLHGLVMVPLLTFGTGLQVLAMALLARYSNSSERRWLRWLAGVCMFSAFLHPFEIFVTIPVVGLTFLRRFGLTIRNLINLGVVYLAIVIGLAPHAVESLRIPWVYEIAQANRDILRFSPASLFVTLGWPALLVVLLLFLGLPERPKPQNTVLTIWFLVTVVMVFVPRIPFAPHLLDGLFVGIGVILSIQIRDLSMRWPALRLPGIRLAGFALVVLSLVPHAVFRFKAWSAPVDQHDTFDSPSAALASDAEVHATEWLRDHANEDELVLTTHDSAPWIAAAPVHSFASHWLCSLLLTHPNYVAAQDSFFAGNLTVAQAHDFLDTFGIRFVFAPNGSPATRYLDKAIPRALFDNWAIYEIPGAHIKPYHDPKIVASY